MVYSKIGLNYQMPHLKLLSLLVLLITFSTSVSAANSWQLRSVDGQNIAVTPTHNMYLKMIKPNKGLWGRLYINMSAEKVKGLNKYRLDKYFPFITVGIEVDGYTRNTNARLDESNGFVRLDIDGRMWEGLKKGKKFIIYLPDGNNYEETLRGSSKALRQLEKRFFK